MSDIKLKQIQDRLEYLEQILELALENIEWLKDANKYYQGFSTKEDKKFTRYFKLETNQNDYEDFLEEMNPIFKNFNLNIIQKEEIKD